MAVLSCYLGYKVITHDNSDCGCFGNLICRSNSSALIQDLFLLIITGFICMSEYIKKNVKYVIMFLISVIVILININLYINNPKKKLTRKIGYIDYSIFYNKIIPNFKFNLNGKTIQFPYKKNILIIGLNREVDLSINLIDDRVFKNIILDQYNLDIIILTKMKKFKKSLYVNTYTYSNESFDKYFKIGVDDKFTLLVENNTIKHYVKELIAVDNIKALIGRYYEN